MVDLTFKRKLIFTLMTAKEESRCKKKGSIHRDNLKNYFGDGQNCNTVAE